jgi:hypothetical protein
MICLRQFSTFAASRGDGLHPKLRALLERAAISPFSEISIRHDGLLQAGPSPDSEVMSSQVEMALFFAIAGSPPCCCAQTGNAQAVGR